MAIYLHEWARKVFGKGSGLVALQTDFNLRDDVLRGMEILFASYYHKSYEEIAFVLFKKDHALYTVLSGPGENGKLVWKPEKVTAREVWQNVAMHGFGYDRYGKNLWAEELTSILHDFVLEELGNIVGTSIYLNCWADDFFSGKKCLTALKYDFDINDSQLKGVNIILASYTRWSKLIPNNIAFILFLKDNKLYMVNAKRNERAQDELFGQWQPKEVTIKELRKMLLDNESSNMGVGTYYNGCNMFRVEMEFVLGKLEK